MRPSELIEKIRRDFQGSEFLKHSRIIEDLICHNFLVSWGDLKMDIPLNASAEKQETLWAHLRRLKSGEPLAYIIGTRYFYENDFFTDPRALIPRTETEILVETALGISPEPQRVLDLGTGTGCIGLTLAKKWPASMVYLIDASAKALELCEKNRAFLNLNNVSLIHNRVGEGSSKTLESVCDLDLIVANPPYIDREDSRVEDSVRAHEPHEALFSNKNGLDCINQWLSWTYPRLKDCGVYLFEFGRGQEKEIIRAVEASQFSSFELIDDHTGNPRFLRLKK